MIKSLKLKCIVSGKESLFSGDYLKKKIDEFGDLDNLQKLYISRDVKTLFKRGYGVDEIKNILNISSDIETPSADIIKLLEDKFKGGSLKMPTINEHLSSFTYNKSDPEVESFINNHIISHELNT
tara:strand:- start:358 stop:732 length:375 start_codon:yes stop_codon:yes gene_type:complete